MHACMASRLSRQCGVRGGADSRGGVRRASECLGIDVVSSLTT